MRLEKLELFGFKSFADKTEFIFQPGLTAFVGPNGCGKSNVVDAVKWVLGEQSVKSLRGGDMQDVIFNGTPSRRSMGYAEATLTLSNTKGLLPTDYETVSVTRRLYRSGESEYSINKQRCRLRDIRDLFMDTGIGMDAYSIIEQGKVDVLLTTNKQGRRAIFEEAAGISKYKAQKKTCLAKLERVSANLLRLGDIIDEVEKRTPSVKYHAAKARRWKALEDSRRELSVALALHQYDQLVKDRDATARQLAELTAEADGLRAGVDRMEAELAAFENAVIEADQRIARLESDDIRISSQLQAADEAVKMNERRIAELNDLEETTKAEIAKSDASLDLMRSEIEQAKSEIGQLEAAVADGQAELARRRSEIQKIENDLRTLRFQIEEKRVQAVDLASERAKLNNELSAIGTQRDHLRRQENRLAERASELRRNLAELGGQKAALGSKGDGIATNIAALEDERKAIASERENIARELAELAESINARRSELASLDSRYELLSDLESKHEGVGAGVRHVLDAAAGDPKLQGICGLVADLIEVDIAHAKAVEAALGLHDQLLITESFDAMTRAMDFLTAGDKGRAHFLALDRVGAGADELRPRHEDPRVVGWATDLVRTRPGFADLARHLLGDVLVVRDIDAARSLASNDGYFRYATLDGQLLNPGGVSVGGSSRGAAGVISRRSELRSLEAHRAVLDADLALLRKQHDEHVQRAGLSKARIEALDARINQGHVELVDARNEIDKINSLVRRLESELETGESERSEIASHIENLAARESAVHQDAARVEQAESELKAGLAGQERALGETESQRDRMRSEATGLEVAQAKQVEKAEGLRQRISQLGRSITERERSLESARTQLQSCVGRRREAAEAILARKAETNQLLERRGLLGREKAEAANQRELVRVQFESKREERNTANQRAKAADSELNELNVHAAEIAMHIENLERRTFDEHDCSLADRHAKTEHEERDWNQVEMEIESVTRKMKAMGDVNTYAITELEELETRAAELTRQRDDLVKAEQTLKEIIRKINRHCRDMFQSTFDKVRENFQGLFRKLFGGGRADIVLEEDVDILDAGIDVIACPPGKEPASITLLSGGEKAMTAVALLFAIFQSKPSPFCILDEVDAPLDEHNIERFAMLIREFLKESQFIVITHSRRTMAMADALYGITMQEPGISTKVSVKFDDEEKVAAAG